MSPRIVILADDLSGAADCASACRRAGMKATVCLEAQALVSSADALALDLNSRDLPPAEARARTLALPGPSVGATLYRKIDSTLRGHVALDIAATLQLAGPGAFAIVCPAYPATGRTVRGGCVYVDGQRLADTEIWALGGRGSTSIMTLLAEAGLAPAALGLETIRGPDLRHALEAARAGGARAAVCDAETDADLDAIVAAGLAMSGMVWAGSGGLTIPLARALSPGGAPESEPVTRRLGPILVAVGSASSISREQLERLTAEARVRPLSIRPQALLDGPDGSGWRPASRGIVAAVGRPGQDTVAVAIDAETPADPALRPALAAAFGLMVGRQLGRFGALVVTGGETARAVLSAAGVRALEVRGELEPGVVLSMAGALPVVTKAGAFGEPDSLVGAVEALRRLPLA